MRCNGRKFEHGGHICSKIENQYRLFHEMIYVCVCMSVHRESNAIVETYVTTDIVYLSRKVSGLIV